MFFATPAASNYPWRNISFLQQPYNELELRGGIAGQETLQSFNVMLIDNFYPAIILSAWIGRQVRYRSRNGRKEWRYAA